MTLHPSALTRWVPRLMLLTATVHIVVAGVEYASRWSDIAADGLWNTVPDSDDARMAALWFMVGGIAFVSLAVQAQQAVRRTGRIPTETGPILLALGVPISVLEPASGGWVLLALGILAFMAARREPSAYEATPSTARGSASL